MVQNGNVIIRCEKADDRPTVRSVNLAAFGQLSEADLVDRLQKEGVVLLSLLAVVGRNIVGHIVFSRMWIDTAKGSIPAVALAPMAVLPGHQRQGVGGRLIRSGLDWLRDRGEQIAIVLGHPDYYPRFGFESAAKWGLTCRWPASADSFMALELVPGSFGNQGGRVEYAQAFNVF